MEPTRGGQSRWRARLRQFRTGNKRIRLMLTLELAVMLPAAALIYVNYYQLKSIERDKALEAAIHRDFQQMLAISEKQLSQKIYMITDEVREAFPSADVDKMERARQLDRFLSERPWLAHAFLFDDKTGLVFRTQPSRLNEASILYEHQRLGKVFSGWFTFEAKMFAEQLQRKTRPITWYAERTKRDGTYEYMNTAFFTLPRVAKHRVVLGGACFDPEYLKRKFFPDMLESLIAYKLGEEGGNRLAMIVYPMAPDADAGSSAMAHGSEPLAASAGWSDGKPEITRDLGDAFRGLALGIKFQGTSVEAIGRTWVRYSFLILGVISLLLVGGLVLTYRSVSKEVALARLKSDFVSNVSHELRTPLSLIRLYAETLELGRITARDKVEEYYRIIRKESERLTALINNILDFSRIEAGRKEYDFRKTDLAELVTNTLDTYRDQIDEQGFTFEQSIDRTIPPVHVDREAIARSLVNLVNNALKYSDREKFIGVRLYRADGAAKLEVVDRGIGIARNEQSKIFEKFYRAGDPLVHNTKGSGLGLSLVRHIAHAHGGEVDVESTPGKGSKFTLTLPLETAAAQQSDSDATVRMAG
ncbi:MAG TPA: HAMP domain-containing sensor histidine kinase [Vicinamibacterales bacterium]|nr:HAMP domain-containing sensor histidine kinase [Vicinamibacterales bacterium]